MKELSSSEFRRTFHQLIEPVTVTVLGRPIGTYTPITVPLSIRVENGEVTIDPPPAKGRRVNLTVAVPDLGDVEMRPGGSFRPAPKPASRKKR